MHITTLTTQLLPSVATLGALAFADDELFAFLRPGLHRYPGYLRAHFARKLRLELNRPDVAVRVMVSDEGDGWWDERVGEEVLGYAVWERNGNGNGNGKREDEGCWGGNGDGDGWWKKFERAAVRLEMKYVDFFRIDPSNDYRNLQTYIDIWAKGEMAIDTVLKEHEDHIWLSFLATHPKYQRRGIGKRLLAWGMARADAEDVPIGVVGSPEGACLYESMGFQDVGFCVVESEGTKIEDRCMIRWPNGEKKEVAGLGELVDVKV